jgi:hypothetical protein
MTKEKAERFPKQIGEELSKAVLSGPAIYANGVITTTFGGGVRITFTETNPEYDVPHFRASAFLENGSALALLGLLNEWMENNPDAKQVWEAMQEDQDG